MVSDRITPEPEVVFGGVAALATTSTGEPQTPTKSRSSGGTGGFGSEFVASPGEDLHG
jgi:hypothetical protein